jgi:ubiquinone/menaquinone biosynthesis C-methylase UbiE
VAGVSLLLNPEPQKTAAALISKLEAGMSLIVIRLYDVLLEPLLHRWKMRIAEAVRQHPPGIVVDICCGIGRQCQMISRFSRTVGVDLDKAMLAYAHRAEPHIPFVCADAVHLPFHEGVFQSAVFSLALHDKPENLRQQMLSELYPLLLADGRVIILDFEPPYTRKSQIGYALIWLIERLAGREHFHNGREFVKKGGVTTFLHRAFLQAETITASEWGSVSIATAYFSSMKR